ncbi:ABC-2 transporter permease [Ruminococcaceae bacterium OttesenSCG-928-A16]|nr:ABC-2 transporter permease [Ruminococcaceae bacterium OttesenSCG-928-A16]
MKGLLIKDLYSLNALKKTYLLFLVLIVGFVAFLDFDSSYVASTLSMFVLMTSTTCFNYDEAYKWDAYGITLPLSRKQIVAARYLLGLGFTFSAGVISLVLSSLISVIKQEPAGWLINLLTTIVVVFIIGLLVNAVSFPVAFRYGAEKARYAMMFITLGPFLFFIIFRDSVTTPLLNFIASTGENFGIYLLVGFLLATLLFYVLSFFISNKVYQKREF